MIKFIKYDEFTGLSGPMFPFEIRAYQPINITHQDDGTVVLVTNKSKVSLVVGDLVRYEEDGTMHQISGPSHQTNPLRRVIAGTTLGFAKVAFSNIPYDYERVYEEVRIFGPYTEVELPSNGRSDRFIRVHGGDVIILYDYDVVSIRQIVIRQKIQNEQAAADWLERQIGHIRPRPSGAFDQYWRDHRTERQMLAMQEAEDRAQAEDRRKLEQDRLAEEERRKHEAEAQRLIAEKQTQAEAQYTAEYTEAYKLFQDLRLSGQTTFSVEGKLFILFEGKIYSNFVKRGGKHEYDFFRAFKEGILQKLVALTQQAICV